MVLASSLRGIALTISWGDDNRRAGMALGWQPGTYISPQRCRQRADFWNPKANPQWQTSEKATPPTRPRLLISLKEFQQPGTKLSNIWASGVILIQNTTRNHQWEQREEERTEGEGGRFVGWLLVRQQLAQRWVGCPKRSQLAMGSGSSVLHSKRTVWTSLTSLPCDHIVW